MSAQRPLGIIAGEHDLPLKIQQRCEELQRPYVVVRFTGYQTTLTKGSYPILETQLTKIGTILNFLHQNRCQELIFVGHIKRPSILHMKFDAQGVEWIKKLGAKIFAGDNTILQGVSELLKEEGFHILNPQDFLENLNLSCHIFTKRCPTALDLEDIKKGYAILKALDTFDVSQSIIIQQGMVLGIEDIGGTEALITNAGKLKRKGKGGTLIKSPKLGQLTTIDMPTVGPATILQLKNSALTGIAITPNTQVIKVEKFIELCNLYDIFCYVIKELQV